VTGQKFFQFQDKWNIVRGDTYIAKQLNSLVEQGYRIEDYKLHSVDNSDMVILIVECSIRDLNRWRENIGKGA